MPTPPPPVPVVAKKKKTVPINERRPFRKSKARVMLAIRDVPYPRRATKSPYRCHGCSMCNKLDDHEQSKVAIEYAVSLGPKLFNLCACDRMLYVVKAHVAELITVAFETQQPPYFHEVNRRICAKLPFDDDSILKVWYDHLVRMFNGRNIGYNAESKRYRSADEFFDDDRITSKPDAISIRQWLFITEFLKETARRYGAQL